jgi:hypothetical protein
VSALLHQPHGFEGDGSASAHLEPHSSLPANVFNAPAVCELVHEQQAEVLALQQRACLERWPKVVDLRPYAFLGRLNQKLNGRPVVGAAVDDGIVHDLRDEQPHVVTDTTQSSVQCLEGNPRAGTGIRSSADGEGKTFPRHVCGLPADAECQSHSEASTKSKT